MTTRRTYSGELKIICRRPFRSHQSFQSNGNENYRLTNLAASSPYTEIVDIGTTYQNNKIKALRIHKAPAGSPAVYIEGTIHAREWVGTMAVNYMASLLVPGNTTDTAALINKFEFYIVPVANVDGFIYTYTTDRMYTCAIIVSHLALGINQHRKNLQPNDCDNDSGVGTDPNRNFGTVYNYIDANDIVIH
ncbi:hypothetical protein BC936DRAFT_138885 [Jimgerdemannia flammicorona]|uniref:Peptidase M14 domain-containing protein n=1 Tax=Jimgerdemannia flammicorona TaxID=994334 RepID=A0A433DI12_9FUNG|nr:hypothetical protein BC936DRAFT_138885 [Jimgerdemannia flammicorona]